MSDMGFWWLDEKAIDSPSGDHAGYDCTASMWSRDTACVVNVTIAMSESLAEIRRNASFDPSGDQVGSMSITSVPAVAGSTRRLSLPSARIVQSFTWAYVSMSLEYAMRLP